MKKIILLSLFVFLAFATTAIAQDITTESSSLTAEEEALLKLLLKKQNFNKADDSKNLNQTIDTTIKEVNDDTLSADSSMVEKTVQVDSTKLSQEKPTTKKIVKLTKEDYITLIGLTSRIQELETEKDYYLRAIKRKSVGKAISGVLCGGSFFAGLIFFGNGISNYNNDLDSYDQVYDEYKSNTDDDYVSNSQAESYLITSSILGGATVIFGTMTLLKAAKQRIYSRKVKKIDMEIIKLKEKKSSFTFIPYYNINTKTASLHVVTSF